MLLGCNKEKSPGSTSWERSFPVDYVYVSCALPITDTSGQNFFNCVILSEEKPYNQGTHLNHKGFYKYGTYQITQYDDPAAILFTPVSIDKYTVEFNTSGTLRFTTGQMSKDSFFSALSNGHLDWFTVKPGKELTIEFQYGGTRDYYSAEVLMKAFNTMLNKPRSEKKYIEYY
jgi:hypothetical protein